MTGKETNMFCNGGVGVDDSIMEGQVGGRRFNSIPQQSSKGKSNVHRKNCLAHNVTVVLFLPPVC